MMDHGPLRLVLVIHDHQPVGNFHGVFEEAYADSYLPFLEVLERFPDVALSLHTSGSLLEWLVEHRPEYVDRVRGLVARGQVEILGGPFYEPILANIPRRDRIGQIEAYSNYLERTFGQPVRGMWVPERVWEQSFVSDVAAAGMEYTILDDYHFKTAGLTEGRLHGYYLSEDEGRLLKILPGSETLRYLIPFHEPHETIDHLRHVHHHHPHAIVAFGDDGEKFGTWPGTKQHVYEHRWLERFFEAVLENRDWLKVTTIGEAVDAVAPLGTRYLPDCSYREMTEWVLEAEPQSELHRLGHLEHQGHDFESLKRFARGGFWRNFRVKYPEANEMYARMLEISERVAVAAEDGTDPILLDRARTELYRAQCNCPYWHGAFGGLYLPHLRNAIYGHLIEADNALETAAGRPPRWVEVTADDYDLDGRKEVRLAGDRLAAYLAPGKGGHLYELDVRATKVNVLATLDRRPEAYHDVVRTAGEQGLGHDDADDGSPRSIHDDVKFKQPDLHLKLGYDHWRRKSLVDHFLQPELPLDAFRRGEGRVSDFEDGAYESTLRRADGKASVRMTRRGNVGPYEIGVAKEVRLDTDNPGSLLVRYELDGLPANLPFHFAVEFGFAAMAAGAEDRFYYDGEGRRIGQLETVHDIPVAERIGLVDEWLGLDAGLELSRPAGIWTFPIETISQSEAGFELVHQSCVVVPHWRVEVGDEGRWEVRIALSLDTSIAKARELAEPVATTH